MSNNEAILEMRAVAAEQRLEEKQEELDQMKGFFRSLAQRLEYLHYMEVSINERYIYRRLNALGLLEKDEDGIIRLTDSARQENEQ